MNKESTGNLESHWESSRKKGRSVKYCMEGLPSSEILGEGPLLPLVQRLVYHVLPESLYPGFQD
jgi:hypothetical protein